MIGRINAIEKVLWTQRAAAGASHHPVSHAGRQLALAPQSAPARSFIGDRPTPPPRPSLNKPLAGLIADRPPLQGDKPTPPPRAKLLKPTRPAPLPPLGATPPLATASTAQQARFAFLAAMAQEPSIAQRVTRQMQGFAEQLQHATDQQRDGIFRVSDTPAKIAAMYRAQAQENPTSALDLKQTADLIKTVISPLKLQDTQVAGRSADEVYRIQSSLLDGLPNKAGREAVVSAFKAWAEAYEQAPADATSQGFTKRSVAMHGFIFEATDPALTTRQPDLGALLALWRKHPAS